jgi:FkbM family methyltransferase
LPEVATFIDVGASDGRWSQEAMLYFPDSQYLLIEAQPVHVAALQRFCAARPNAQFVPAAAGAQPGQINFQASSPFGGVAGYEPFGLHNIVVPVTTIDEQVRAHQLSGPFLIKLDTHGFEVPILAGASQTLAQTAALVVEVYNFTTGPECLQFYEQCAWLRERAFRCADIFDVMRRPSDDMLWQMDMVFICADRPEFRRNSYE